MLMSLLSEDGVDNKYRMVLPPAHGQVAIRPVMILQLQGFDESGALYETFNFFYVNIWSSLLSRDIRSFGNHGQRTPSIILTRDIISSNGEAAMTSAEFQGIISAGSYSKSMDSGKKLLDAVWTASLCCNVVKHGHNLFFIFVQGQDQSIAQLELDHKVRDSLGGRDTWSHLLIDGIGLSDYYLGCDSHQTKNYSRPNFETRRKFSER